MGHKVTAATLIQSKLVDRWFRGETRRATSIVYVGTDKIIVCWMREWAARQDGNAFVDEGETALAYVEGFGVVQGELRIGGCTMDVERLDTVYPRITR